ncbi:hypothetical protein MNBD_NITROSPINAE02-1184 [hydrothermal vent metagenome]|uniref:Cytochrome c domain-containing protein n=1 Tax=hydrothermal vent metagenome TaxID=652676 RepID=A0A3B1D1K1_9ZZZZ
MIKRLSGLGTLAVLIGLTVLITGCPLSSSGGNFTSTGQKLFNYYCADCHGVSGQGNGYNAAYLDFEPRNLTDSDEVILGDLTNEQLFLAISRDLKNPSEDAPSLVSFMPTFRDTLAEAERWAIISYIRTLHPNKAPEITLTKEMKKKRPRFPRIRTVDIDPEFMSNAENIANGKELFEDTYGCLACHSVGGEGGNIGPPLDRAGFMSNADWLYRWVKNPQGLAPHTKMPSLGLSDEDAMAVVAYLKTLQSPTTVAAIPKEQEAEGEGS